MLLRSFTSLIGVVSSKPYSIRHRTPLTTILHGASEYLHQTIIHDLRRPYVHVHPISCIDTICL